MNRSEYLTTMLQKGATQDEAFAFFDQLETVNANEMWGLWKGEEIRTGHPFEGILQASGWYGKDFINEEEVHPLMMEKGNRELYTINPAFIPLQLPFDKIPKKLIALTMKLIRPLVKTKKSAARLRMIEYRRKVTAAMVYDKKGIIDIFRKVDDNTLLGIMDIKQFQSDKSYFFLLRRVKERN